MNILTDKERVKRFENYGLGLFIHWGLYSIIGAGEWVQEIHNVPVQKYQSLTTEFDANKFNAKEIVKAAKDMGANYIVFTAKHHDGFCLFDTQGITKYDSVHSQSNRDFIKELSDECHKSNIQLFIYMALYDWHDSDYDNDFSKYLSNLRKMIKILSTNYGEIGGFWFDGAWDKPNANWEWTELVNVIRENQPNSIITNNTGLENRGKLDNPGIDVVTFERGMPDKVNHNILPDKYNAGEISLTLNKHWGSAVNDFDYISMREVIESLTSAKKAEANILINIGLEGSGNINSFQHEMMKMVGNWISYTKEAFFNSEVLSQNGKDFIVRSNVSNLKYAFIHDLKIAGNKNVVLGGEEEQEKVFDNIVTEPHSIYWLDTNEPIKFKYDSLNQQVTLLTKGFDYGSDYVVRVCAFN
ncbi:alpha-L-fucosidase [Companilactobacillus sp. RD055328]|uniref:alpha-L-fucosidase n=1 Tax=Companilactobacillus sp. RD055328 TaxID=2916634 RepID=UPI001FC82CFC|nr:alpha-L-fucosidase [Companilactobacillus sp. RD055328]GKQ43443.1 alpha-L-fucosidase [Companilactobacillus sp. RD055328]